MKVSTPFLLTRRAIAIDPQPSLLNTGTLECMWKDIANIYVCFAVQERHTLAIPSNGFIHCIVNSLTSSHGKLSYAFWYICVPLGVRLAGFQAKPTNNHANSCHYDAVIK